MTVNSIPVPDLLLLESPVSLTFLSSERGHFFLGLTLYELVFELTITNANFQAIDRISRSH